MYIWTISKLSLVLYKHLHIIHHYITYNIVLEKYWYFSTLTITHKLYWGVLYWTMKNNINCTPPETHTTHYCPFFLLDCSLLHFRRMAVRTSETLVCGNSWITASVNRIDKRYCKSCSIFIIFLNSTSGNFEKFHRYDILILLPVHNPIFNNYWFSCDLAAIAITEAFK